jgi:hypothetical protein
VGAGLAFFAGRGGRRRNYFNVQWCFFFPFQEWVKLHFDRRLIAKGETAAIKVGSGRTSNGVEQQAKGKNLMKERRG